MQKLLMHFAVAGLLASAVYAEEATIGVYVDAAGTQCTGTTSGTMITGSVWVNLAGAAAAGITGAEFRIDNNHRFDCTVVVSPDPAATIMLGDAFNLAGTNFAYETCQTGTRVRLMTFSLIENTPETDIWLTLTQHARPTNWTFACPLVTLCDAPAYTKVCVGLPNSVAWSAVLNPSEGVAAECAPVGVSPSSWSQVKGLYRG